MEDWQLWVGLLTLAGFSNIGAFWYGYGKLNQKVDGINSRLDRLNGDVKVLRRDVTSHGERIARAEGIQGSRGGRGIQGERDP